MSGSAVIDTAAPLLGAGGGTDTARVPGHVTRHLVKGSSALGVAIFVERGLGFAANILAFRLGGAATFGAVVTAPWHVRSSWCPSLRL